MNSEALAGAYDLASLDAIRPNGEIVTGWLGPKPTGLIVYHSMGTMSVQIMRGPRDDSQKDSYYAYFGTYELDVRAGTIIHRVRGSLHSDEVGLEYRQSFTLFEDVLVLTTAKHPVDGEERMNRLVWNRIR
jgi:Lipocalin-like domain